MAEGAGEDRNVRAMISAIPNWLTVVVVVVTVVVFAVRADSGVAQHERRIDQVEQILPDIRDRLSRIEGKLDAQIDEKQ